MAQVRKTLLTTAIAAAMIPASASGAGFALIQNSAKSGGTSYAGTAATPQDPATVFFNPAGMVRTEGTTVSAGVSYVAPEFDYEDEGSTRPELDGDGNPIGLTRIEGQDSTSDEVGYPPNFYYMNRFDEDWAFGLAINTPFGSRTEYDDDWVGRYHSIESEIRAFNINANIAHDINDRVSVGFGINAQRFEATLSRKVPFPGQPNPDTDGEVEIDGDSWAAGVNVGLLADVTDNTQLGLAWRSKVSHRLTGDVTGESPGSGDMQRVGGAASLDTPSSYTMSLRHEPEFEDRLAILFDAAYTRWNRIDDVTVDFDQPLVAADGENQTDIALNFRDSWRGSLGLTWDQTEQLQLRTGFTFDQSAVKDSETRTPRVPDNHRRWVSVGAGYEFHNGLELDASYSHIFINDTKINNTNEQDQTLRGEFDSSANIFSLQATYRY